MISSQTRHHHIQDNQSHLPKHPTTHMIAVIKNDTSLVATPMPSTPRPRPWRYITEGVPSFFVSVIKPITDHNRATTTDNENGHCLIGIALHSITGNPPYLWLFLMSHLLQELSATSKPLQQWFRCPEEPQEPFQPPPGPLTELSGPMPMVRSNQVHSGDPRSQPGSF